MLNHYYATDYLHHLADITDSELYTFCIDGFLINFFVKDGACGKVVNSNPFYGSHGGFYPADGQRAAAHEVISMVALADWLTQPDVASVTIVENPYCGAAAEAKNHELIDIMNMRQPISYEIIDRFSSVRWVDNITDFDALMTSYHSKTRNCLRKYLKSGAKIKTYNATSRAFDDHILWIADQHRQGIEAKNGAAKPLSYFQGLTQYYSSDRLEIKVSYLDDEPIAGLLNFKTCNQTEYWTPVITDMGKVNNAIYGLIDDTLKDIINQKGALLNFGGSWATQGDLQRFKLRFGSDVRAYHYHCFIQSVPVLQTSSDDLLQSYPYFFVRRFS